MLTIKEHKSASYAPRTYHNATTSDVTVALATDYNTAGEKLTHKAAGDKYLQLPFSEDYLQLARTLWKHLNKLGKELPVINVAGNGVYTLIKKGITQEQANRIVYDILAKVHAHHPIGKIISGGQTGIDLAGGVAAFKLGIECEMTYPKGFLMRMSNGKDYEHTEEFIRKMVEDYARVL